MKMVRLEHNIVREIIPDYALPVEKWYGARFAAECIEVADEVEQGWVYDPSTGVFSEPVEPEPTPVVDDEPTAEELMDILLGVSE